MRTIYLPYVVGKIAKVLSYIAVVLLDTVHFVLTPFTWIQFKGHVAMASLAGVGYAYMHFFAHYGNALDLAFKAFALAIGLVLLAKCARKAAYRLRQPLMRVVYAPVGVCIQIRPLFTQKHTLRVKNIA